MSFSSFFKRKKGGGGAAMDSLLAMGKPFATNDASVGQQTGDRMNGIQSNGIQMKSSIASISARHSHRNVKPCHQMLLAESMFDESMPAPMVCRLSKTLNDVLHDNNILPYFIQFMESQETVAKHLIRFWIQAECLSTSQLNVRQQQMGDDKMAVKMSAEDVHNKCLKSDEFEKQFINDALGIYNKYISASAIHNIDLPADLRQQIGDTLINRKSNINVFDVFSGAQKFVVDKVESNYFETFLRSSYFCKYQIDILTDGSVGLADVLFNDSRLASNFVEFMEIEGMKSYVDFLLMYRNYKKTCIQHEDSKAIYDRFFSQDSNSILGFSEGLRQYISEQMEKDASSCFDKAAFILVQYFEKTYLKQFLQSEFYFDYLSHCIASLQLDMRLKRTHMHKRTGSDSSYNSDCSIMSSNGLRDTDFYHTASPLRHKKTSSHVSVEQGPDALWKRDLSGNLQIAHVDQYGRTFSFLEPEPDKMSSGPLSNISLSKVMRKFALNSSNDKAKEDMAWQVAEMIVNDVCKITQHASNDVLHPNPSAK